MFFRLIVMFILITVIPLFVMRGILLVTIKDRLYNERVDNIIQHGTALTQQMVSTDYFGGENRDAIMQQMSQLAAIYDGRIVAIDDTYTVVADTYYRIYDKTVISEDALDCLQGKQLWHYNEAVDMIEVSIPVTDDTGAVLGALLISTSMATKTAAYSYILKVSDLVFGIICVIVLVVAFICSREFAKPFKDMVKSINHVSEGDFSHFIQMKGYTEIEQISAAFNKMLGKLKTLEESRQEFVSNVSHELKTPLTSMKVLAESLNMQPDAPKE